MSALAGNLADVYIVAATGAGTSFTNEACTANTARTEYQITNTGKRYWTTATAITVQTSPDGSTWTTVTSGFQLAYAGGKVLFTFAQAVGTQVRVSGAYLAVSQLAQSSEWSLDVSIDTTDATTFGATWKAMAITKRGGVATVKRFWLDEYFWTNAGNPFLLVLYLSQPAGTRVEGLFKLTANSLQDATAGLLTESASFIADGPLNYSAS